MLRAIAILLIPTMLTAGVAPVARLAGAPMDAVTTSTNFSSQALAAPGDVMGKAPSTTSTAYVFGLVGFLQWHLVSINSDALWALFLDFVAASTAASFILPPLNDRELESLVHKKWYSVTAIVFWEFLREVLTGAKDYIRWLAVPVFLALSLTHLERMDFSPFVSILFTISTPVGFVVSNVLLRGKFKRISKKAARFIAWTLLAALLAAWSLMIVNRHAPTLHRAA